MFGDFHPLSELVKKTPKIRSKVSPKWRCDSAASVSGFCYGVANSLVNGKGE